MVAFVIQAGAALVLLYAGASKLGQPAEIRLPIGAVGLPGSPPVLASAPGPAELGTAAVLVLAPSSPVTAVIVAALGAGFAVAGVLAMARRVLVQCACLGPALSGRLGARQLSLLPLWIVVAGAGLVDRPVPLAGDRLVVLVLLAIAVTLVAAVQLTPLAREHRALVHMSDGDMNDGIASRLDLTVFPSALVFEHGSLTQAETLPSSRQLDRITLNRCPLHASNAPRKVQPLPVQRVNRRSSRRRRSRSA